MYKTDDFKLILLVFSMNGGGRLNTTCETTVSIPEDSDEAKEVIEVQILPQVNIFGLSGAASF